MQTIKLEWAGSGVSIADMHVSRLSWPCIYEVQEFVYKHLSQTPTKIADADQVRLFAGHNGLEISCLYAHDIETRFREWIKLLKTPTDIVVAVAEYSTDDMEKQHKYYNFGNNNLWPLGLGKPFHIFQQHAHVILLRENKLLTLS